MFLVDLLRYTFDTDENLSKFSEVIWHFLPVIEALVIVTALDIALHKLRSFQVKYGLDVDKTKLKLHFTICTLLLLIFILRFFRSLTAASVFEPSD